MHNNFSLIFTINTQNSTFHRRYIATFLFYRIFAIRSNELSTPGATT